MKCSHCNFEFADNLNQCPNCGTSANSSNQPSPMAYPYQTYQYNGPYNYYAQNQPYGFQRKPRSKGEIAALVMAIVISVLSVIAAHILFIQMMMRSYEKNLDEYEKYLSSYYDENDDKYDNYYDYFHNYGDNSTSSDKYDDNYYNENAADKGKPIEFLANLYSFTDGKVRTKYELTLVETYSGEAAVKMLQGEKLPEYSEDDEILLAKFNLDATWQIKQAYVTLDLSENTVAYGENDEYYLPLKSINYKNKNKLFMEGDTCEKWLAFVVKKGDNPYIGHSTDYKMFKNRELSISDPNMVTAGEAIETESVSSSN